jgi:hypothetical protein
MWSSGGGVQSTAIAALIVQGRLPKPDLAVIADTERELSTTWAYMEATTLPALASVGVTLHRVKKSAYATVDLYGGKDGNTLLIPAFTTQGDDIGKLSGFCSNEWKKRVIQRWATREHGVKAAMQWVGISTDEARRATASANGKWGTRYPLIELNMSRADCFAAVEAMGWPEPPRSSCWMCPNHHESEWLWQRMAAPQDHRKAIVFDREMRKRDPHAWLHPSATPLEGVVFDEANEVMFGKNCQTGLCFV